ncbi:hypothetical protein ACP275_14G264200 [Erythranthe tilingii]
MNNPSPSFHEIKKQASFFFREKIKTARLALTDATPAQLLAEEATNGNLGGPDARILKILTKAAFEVDDYWRIVGILHKRLVKFEKRNWVESYKGVVVLEYLLTHGPDSVAEEFQRDRDVISQLATFQYIDEKGFNWGLNVRNKCERTLKLLEKGPILKEEREKARKISIGIQGFGSFSHRTSSGQEINQESLLKAFDRCNSQFNDHTFDQQDSPFAPSEKDTIKTSTENNSPSEKSSCTPVDHSKETLGVNEREAVGESESLLNERKNEPRGKFSMEECHPFVDGEHLTALI